MNPRQFATAMGYKPNYGNQLQKDGRLVMAPDGKTVLFEESKARFEATKDPSKQGVADRHAAARANADQPPAPPAVDTAAGQIQQPAFYAAPPDPAIAAAGNSFQKSKAIEKHFQALAAKREYELAIQTLRDAHEVESAVATILTELRLALENLPNTLAPALAANNSEDSVRTELAGQFEYLLQTVSNRFQTLSEKVQP